MPHIHDPQVFADRQTEVANMRSQLQTAINRLQAIEGATFASNAQRDAAIKDEATIIRRMLRVLARLA
jgi:hypothetical protein